MPTQPASRSEQSFSLRAALLTGVTLVLGACIACWGAFQWEQLSDRAERAESRLRAAHQELAKHRRHAAELRDIEAELRDELSQLAQLVETQSGPEPGSTRVPTARTDGRTQR